MSHPLLVRSRLAIYIGLWILLGVAQIYPQTTILHLPLKEALADGLVSHLWFAVLGFSMWYFIRHVWSFHTPILNLLGTYTAGGVVVVFIWQAGAYTVLSIFNADDPLYLEYLYSSLPMRCTAGFGVYALLLLTYLLFLGAEALRQRKENEIHLRESLKASELELLKSQINPHFLFNSLNSASLLTLTAPERAHEMIVSLSEYLRYSISGKRQQFAAFHQELENARCYLDIEKIRFGKKLELEFQVDDASQKVFVPTMILQPLFENAIKHGVYESTGQVYIQTRAKVEGNYLQLEVRNTFEPNIPAKKGAGLGLLNLRERLRMLYGAGNSWLLAEKKEKEFVVKLSLPKEVP
ncbi:MAG TPA: histidine kinase [Fibrobacteraceae bacterium]|nr:histidine kinase [Fibrobacteraceae bacterium]